MHPFLVLRFHDMKWPRLASRWLLVSQGSVGDDGYICGMVSALDKSSEVRVFSSVEWCDAQIVDVYEPALAQDGYKFTGQSAVVALNTALVLGRRGKKGWAMAMMYALQDAFMARDVSHWRGTQAEYDAIPYKQPSVMYEITD